MLMLSRRQLFLYCV